MRTETIVPIKTYPSGFAVAATQDDQIIIYYFSVNDGYSTQQMALEYAAQALRDFQAVRDHYKAHRQALPVYLLHDLTALNRLDSPLQQQAQRVSDNLSANINGYNAIVVNQDGTGQALAAVFSSIFYYAGANIVTRIFYHRAEALAWLRSMG